MLDTVKLKNKIAENGTSITFVSNALGITREGFYNKINGVTEFKGSEISKLSKVLKLTKKERDDIFFANDSELNSRS